MFLGFRIWNFGVSGHKFDKYSKINFAAKFEERLMLINTSLP